MCSSIDVVSVVSVVVSGLLLLPCSHENMILANENAKHPRLLSVVQILHAKIEVYVLLPCFIYIEAVNEFM
jgi:hypothetical protein